MDYMKNSTRHKTIISIFILLALAALALRLAFFTTSIRHAPVTTDEAIEFLMAKHIAAGQPHLLVMSQPYRFPLESYVIAPFVALLPRTEFGARLIPCLFGLLDVVLLLLILRKMLQSADDDRRHVHWGRYCAALLILFPSAYLLMQQSAYRITGYTAMTTCGLLAILAALHGQRLRWSFACGLAGGLAVSSTMLAMPVTVVTGIYTTLAGNGRRLIGRLSAWLAGLGLGLLPFLIAKWLIPGAHKAVAGYVGWNKIFRRLTEGSFRQVVLSAFGIEPNVFPDEAPLTFISYLDPAAFYLFLIIFIGLLLVRVGALLMGLIRRRRLELTPADLFIGIALLATATAVSSARFDSRSTRYILPAIWCFPMICAGLDMALANYRGRTMRIMRSALVLVLTALVAYNIYASVRLMRAWMEPEFAVRHISTPDLRPAIDFLKERGITHCFAQHWTAYRINFITDEAIICSQPYNERFSAWPIPYKAQVVQATNIAYVLTDRTRFLTPDRFERHMKIMGVTSQRAELGDFKVYYDFSAPEFFDIAQKLPYQTLKTDASHGKPDVHKLTDGNYQSRWTSRASQQTGMWVQVELPGVYNINSLTLHYGRFHHDRPKAFNILAQTAAGWQPIATNVPATLDKFTIKDGQPIYEETNVSRHTITRLPIQTDALRLEISKARPGRNWTITQLEIGVLEASQPFSDNLQ